MSKLRPVVLVPGIFGSILRNQNGEILWPCASRWEMWKIPFNMVRLWGTTDADGVFTGFSSDVISAVPGLSGCGELIPGVESFYCFKRIIDMLQASGYRAGVSLFAFTYDFRHAALFLAEKLRHFLLELHLDSPPILITHSIGSLLPRVLQHTDNTWSSLFSAQIAIAPTFDGGNGSGLLAVIDGYDLHFWFLRNMTRGLWCNSGMQLGILQCSSGIGYQQYVCVTYGDEAISDQSPPRYADIISQTAACELWGGLKLLKTKDLTVIEGILQRVLKSPGRVTRDTYYWAHRFAKFLRGGISSPRFILPCENRCYSEPGCVFRLQFQFFQLQKQKSAGEAEVTRQRRLKTVRYGMWSVACPKLNTQGRVLSIPDRSRFLGIDLDNITVATFQAASYHDYFALSQIQFEKTLRELPDAIPGNLIDLYQQIAPEGSIEGLIFGQNVDQHKRHYDLRMSDVQFDGFKFASIAGAGVPTPAHSIFREPVPDAYELHRRVPEYVYGDGDGTALLTTQLADAVPEACVVSRHVIGGVSHAGLLVDGQVLQILGHLVGEMQ